MQYLLQLSHKQLLLLVSRLLECFISTFPVTQFVWPAIFTLNASTLSFGLKIVTSFFGIAFFEFAGRQDLVELIATPAEYLGFAVEDQIVAVSATDRYDLSDLFEFCYKLRSLNFFLLVTRIKRIMTQHSIIAAATGHQSAILEQN